jgi:hypothetical protein
MVNDDLALTLVDGILATSSMIHWQAYAYTSKQAALQSSDPDGGAIIMMRL